MPGCKVTANFSLLLLDSSSLVSSESCFEDCLRACLGYSGLERDWKEGSGAALYPIVIP